MHPVMYLPARCSATIAAYEPVPTSAAGLPQLAAHLQAHGTLYGAIMPAGAYNLSTLLPQRYVQQHMLYSAKTQRRLEAHTHARDDAADTITALLQARLWSPRIMCWYPCAMGRSATVFS